MKSITLAAVACLISLSLFAESGKPGSLIVTKPNWESSFVDGVAAEVKVKVHEKDKDNKGQLVVTCEELRRELAPLLPQLKQAVPDEKDRAEHIKAITNDILNGKINRFLIEQSGYYKGMRVPEAFAANHFNAIFVSRFGGDRGILNQYLKDNDMTEQGLKDSLKSDVLVDYLRSEKQKECSMVSPKQINEYYTKNIQEFQKPAQVHLFQIFIAPDRADQVPQVYEALKKGESFSSVAQKYSQDEKQKSGGDWGWVNPADLRPEIAKKIESLSPKSYSEEPLIINGSNFIFYVDEKQAAQDLSLKEATPIIEDMLSQKAAQDCEEKWIRDLRGAASIKIFI